MNPLWIKAFGLVFAISMAMLAPQTVAAQTTSEDLSEADLASLIELARTAYEAGEFEQAIHYLLMADRKEPNSRLMLNVARSYGQLEDCVRSLVYTQAYIRHPDTEEALLEVAKTQFAEAGDCPGYSDSLSGRLVLESEPFGAKTFVNGEPSGTAPHELAGYPAGEYKIRFELEGYETVEEVVTLKAQTDHTVSVTMKEPREPEVVVEPPIVKPTTDGSSPNYAAFGLLGAGAAALVTGAVFDLVLIPDTDAEREQLNASQRDEYDELTEQRNSQANIAVAAYITGALLVAGGAGWLIYDMVSAPDESKESEMERRLGWRVVPTFDANQAGFTLFRSF